MSQDENILEQYDEFLLTGKYSFLIYTPIFNRLKDLGLIEDSDEITNEMLNLAYVDLVNSRESRTYNKGLTAEALTIKAQGIKHRRVKTRALLFKDRVLIKKCFEFMRDNKVDLADYLDID